MLGKILFIGQPEYFRDIYFDAIAQLGHEEFHINSADFSLLEKIPNIVADKKINTIIMFRPEWFSYVESAFLKLKQMGVRTIGYSTEPIPQRKSFFNHKDLCARYDNLKKSKALDWDLIVHYDEVSETFLRQENFDKLIVHPLPVSKVLFYPENNIEDLDFCFLGRSTERRERFLIPLKMKYKLVHIAHGMVGEDARSIVKRSRYVINLHNEDYLNFENRVPQAIFCNKTVLSEPLTGNILRPNVDYLQFHSVEKLVSLAEHCINTNFTLKSLDPKRLECFDIRHLLAKISLYFEGVG